MARVFQMVFVCRHFSMSGVSSLKCSICGPLKPQLPSGSGAYFDLRNK